MEYCCHTFYKKTGDEIVRYIKSMSLYCVEREGKYINFSPVVLSKYFSSDRIKGEYFDGNRYREITFHPEISDLQHLLSFKFEDLTFRGTVEFRSVSNNFICCIKYNIIHINIMAIQAMKTVSPKVIPAT